MRTTGHGGYDCPGAGALGNCALDISAMRWDASAGQYSWDRADATSPLGKDDAVGWGMPFYSPVDGEIVACWRKIPDDVEVGQQPTACPGPSDPTSCVAGGNHVIIRTYDGFLVSLNHFQKDSIPSALCPITDELLFNDDPKKCTTSGWEAALREGARLDNRSIAPIPVRTGDFVGRMGLSGNTGGVHLHMSVNPYTLDSNGDYCQQEEPAEFDESWLQVRTPGVAPEATDWDRLEGDELPIDGTTEYILFPDPLGPRVDEAGIEIGSVPALALTPQGGTAAYRNSSGNLAATSFLFDSDGQFVFGTPVEEGGVTALALSRINNTAVHAVSAVRNSADKLQIIPYFVKANADMVRGIGRTESTAGVGHIETTPSPTHDGVVVAIQNSSSAVSVINYGVTTTGTWELTVDRRGSAATGTAIADVDVATVVMGRGVNETSGAFKGVITVERRSSDDTLWVRSWQINTSGSTVTLVDSEQAKDVATNTAFTVTDVDVTVTGSLEGREFAVVSAATASGLRVQSWEITSTGQLSRIEQVNAGAVTHLSSARAGQQDAILAARSGDNGTLSLLSFDVAPEGTLRRVGTRDAGAIPSLAVDGRPGQQDAVVMAPAVGLEMTLYHYLTNYSSAL